MATHEDVYAALARSDMRGSAVTGGVPMCDEFGAGPALDRCSGIMDFVNKSNIRRAHCEAVTQPHWGEHAELRTRPE